MMNDSFRMWSTKERRRMWKVVVVVLGDERGEIKKCIVVVICFLVVLSTKGG
jgi:hypothetical protein